MNKKLSNARVSWVKPDWHSVMGFILYKISKKELNTGPSTKNMGRKIIGW